MKITDLKIGEFATRNWYSGNNKSLYVKRFSEEKYEYWEDGSFSSSVKKTVQSLTTMISNFVTAMVNLLKNSFINYIWNL